MRKSDSNLAVQNLHGTYRNGQSDFSFPAASLRITSETMTGAGFSVAQSNVRSRRAKSPRNLSQWAKRFFVSRSCNQDRIQSRVGRPNFCRAVRSDLALQNLQGSYRNGQIRAATRADLTTDLASLKADMGSAEKISARASLEHAVLDLSENSSAVEGAAQLTFDGTNARYRLKAGDVSVRAIQAAFAGTGSLGNARADGRLEGSLTARANVPRRVALELVRAVPAIGTDPPISAVLADSLRDVNLRFPKLVVTHAGNDTSLAIPAPASLAGANGVKLTLSPQDARPLWHKIATATDGAFGLEISGGGASRAEALRLHLSHARRNRRRDIHRCDAIRREAEPARLQGHPFVRQRRGGPAQRPPHFRIHALHRHRHRRSSWPWQHPGERGQGQALRRADASGFGCRQCRLARCRNLDRRVGAIPLAQSAIAGAQGRVELAGDAAGARSGHVVVDPARCFPIRSRRPRFLPIDVSGDLDLAGTEWHGVLGLTTHNRRFATASVRHEMQTGAGSASIEAKDLSFEPGMFQPADISPLLAPLGTRVAGHTDFTGLVTWNDKGMQSNGRLHVMSVNLQSRSGAVRGVNGDLALSSLMPVALAPSQTIAIDRLDWLVPVEQAKLQFSFKPTEIQALESASANVAGGRVSLDPETIPFTPGATTQGRCIWSTWTSRRFCSPPDLAAGWRSRRASAAQFLSLTARKACVSPMATSPPKGPGVCRSSVRR